MKGILALMVLGLIAATASSKEDSKKNDDIGTVIGIDLGTTYSW